MTPITPLHQPPLEDLRNALQMLRPMIAERWAPAYLRPDLERIESLIREALVQIGEPTEAAIHRMQLLLESHQGMMELEPDYQRYLRDCVVIILKAQLEASHV